MPRARGRQDASALRSDAREPFRRETGRGPVQSAPLFVCGGALLVCGAALVLSAVVTLFDDARAIGPLLAVGAGSAAVGAALVRTCRVPTRLTTPTAFGAVAALALTLVAVSSAAYLAAGTFTRVDEAVFESVAGITTTALTGVGTPEQVPMGVLFWRATTQWLGGFSALVIVVALLPFLGVGGLEVSDVERSARRFGLLSPRVIVTIRRLGLTYLGLTAAGVVLFLVGGMAPFDAVTYAFTTISTGGFANHRGSFAYFDSALIEWLAIGGMALAGANIALLARGLRGQLGPLQRSAELRVYGAVLVVGSLLVAWGTTPDTGYSLTSVRHAAFSVTSVVSTTGASVTDWGGWPMGPQVLLLLLMGVGAMSGSTGGGFRLIRAMALFGYVRREVVRQLHARSVLVVKIGRIALDEALVARLVGYQVLFVIVAAIGAVGVAAFDTELVTAMTGAVSALSNVGPALGELSPGGAGAAGLDTGARLVLVPVMLLGRLEIAPVLVGLGALGGSVRGRWRRGGGDR